MSEKSAGNDVDYAAKSRMARHRAVLRWLMPFWFANSLPSNTTSAIQSWKKEIPGKINALASRYLVPAAAPMRYIGQQPVARISLVGETLAIELLNIPFSRGAKHMPQEAAVSKVSAQGYKADPRNDNVLVYVNGEFMLKDQATVSIFDSGFIVGDGVWEGLRLVNDKLIAVDEHMERLFTGARSIDLDIGLSRDEVKELVWSTLKKNNMHDGVHIRLMITRGRKSTANQDPRFALGKPTIVITAEYKVVNPEVKARGMSLYTSTFRCSSPDVFDLRLNSHSRLNLIQALIQAIHAGADEALMLDPYGFVASCNSTNFFVVRRGALWTSTGRYNFNGITHRTVMRLARQAGIELFVGDYTLAEVYSADEGFVTGTLSGITPVVRIDGKTIGTGKPGPVTAQIAQLYDTYLHS